MSDARDEARLDSAAIPLGVDGVDGVDARTQHVGAHRIQGSASCARILLVGECNPLSLDPRYALHHEPANSSGHRLQQRILGVRPRQTYLPIWRANLCFGSWDPDAALDRARDLLPGAPGVDGAGHLWRTIVALGVKVAEAIRRASGIDLEFLADPVRIGHSADRVVLLVSLPHPSGRNHGWNDVGQIRRARSVLARAAPGVPWGEVDLARSRDLVR